jgi:hypothetical protein
MRLLFTTTALATISGTNGDRKASLRLARDFDVQYAAVGMECNDLVSFSTAHFETKYNATANTDVGVLSCDPFSVCVLDETSARGGRCVASDTSRNLQANCTKCIGTFACDGLDPTFVDNYIGCDSCNGYAACYGIDREYLISLELCVTQNIVVSLDFIIALCHSGDLPNRSRFMQRAQGVLLQRCRHRHLIL